MRFLEQPLSLDDVRRAIAASKHQSQPDTSQPDGPRVFPLRAKIAADLLTPTVVYLKMAKGSRYSVILESVRGAQDVLRYSYIAVDPRLVVESGRAGQDERDPLCALEKELNACNSAIVHDMPPFTGGAIGYIGYDCVRYFEPQSWSKPPQNDPLQLPESVLMYFDTIVAFDHAFQNIHIISNMRISPDQVGTSSVSAPDDWLEQEYARVRKEIDRVAQILIVGEAVEPEQIPVDISEEQEFKSNIGPEGYKQFVRTLKEHIRRGDIIQAVPSQRIARRTDLHPFNIYRIMRSVNPSPYMFFINIDGEFQLIGASPELLVRTESVPVFQQIPAMENTVNVEAAPISVSECYSDDSHHDAVAVSSAARAGYINGHEGETFCFSNSDNPLSMSTHPPYEIEITTHPIAGTIKRGQTPREDKENEKRLLASAKDQAEHVMLVDLARNDVNRVCRFDSTVLDHLMRVERFSHVMHLVSQVRGRLELDKTRFDAFRSVFPAGTVSGAPKIRAIQLVYGLENEKRGVYAGAIGTWGYMSQQMETCIALRTIVFKDSVAYLQAGGGIVFDSEEQEEYDETMNKLSANIASIKKAEQYFSVS